MQDILPTAASKEGATATNRSWLARKRLPCTRAVLSASIMCLLLLFFLNGCATPPTTANTENYGRLMLSKHNAVMFKHQYLIFEPGYTRLDTIFMNGIPCKKCGSGKSNDLGAWVKLEVGMNQVVVTGIKDGKTMILDSATIAYWPDYMGGMGPHMRGDYHGAFADPDGDGVVNDIDKDPVESEWSLDADGNGAVEDFHTSDADKKECSIIFFFPLRGQVN